TRSRAEQAASSMTRRSGAPNDVIDIDALMMRDMVTQFGQHPYRIGLLSAIDGVTFPEVWRGGQHRNRRGAAPTNHRIARAREEQGGHRSHEGRRGPSTIARHEVVEEGLTVVSLSVSVVRTRVNSRRQRCGSGPAAGPTKGRVTGRVPSDSGFARSALPKFSTRQRRAVYAA